MVVAIVTGVPFGYASLHPCLNSIAPTGLRNPPHNENVTADMPRHVPTVGRRLEKNNELLGFHEFLFNTSQKIRLIREIRCFNS